MTKEESTKLAVLIAEFRTLNETVKEIEKHQASTNGHIADTIRVVDKARYIADNAALRAEVACKKAEDVMKFTNRNFMLIGLGLLAIFGAIIASMIMLM